MPHNVQESDWKAFREFREVALQRFCERVLEELLPLIQDRSRSHHERYLAIFPLIQQRDEQLARAFNDPGRSRMIVQLATIHALDLLQANSNGSRSRPGASSNRWRRSPPDDSRVASPRQWLKRNAA